MKNSTTKISAGEIGFFGMDVHKKTITIAEYGEHGPPRSVKTIANEANAVKKYFEKRLNRYSKIYTVYEAGGCGFHLHNQLVNMSIECIVCAPSKLETASGNRVKCDRIDAERLGQKLRNEVICGGKELAAVHIPQMSSVAMRELCRHRERFLKLCKSIQNSITGRLQSHGINYDLTKNLWTKTFRAWLLKVNFGDRLICEIHMAEINELDRLEALVKTIDEKIKTKVQEWNKWQVVKALMCFRGISWLNATKMVAEVENFSRFEKAGDIMAYIGLTPSEYSSAERTTKGHITKQGNKRVRVALVEASKSVDRPVKSKKKFREDFEKKLQGFDNNDLPPEVLEHAYKAMKRLNDRHFALTKRGKARNVATIACARELLGFIWWVALMMETVESNQPSKTA